MSQIVYSKLHPDAIISINKKLYSLHDVYMYSNSKCIIRTGLHVTYSDELSLSQA